MTHLIDKQKPLAIGLPEASVNPCGNTNSGSYQDPIVATSVKDCQDRCPSNVIRLPNGKPVGQLIWEEGLLVWERRVSAKHVWRKRNAWSINRGILEQLIAVGVQLLRYTASEGDYELTLDTFLSQRKCDEGAACGEDVFSVPRCRWRFLPNLNGLPLFAFEGSA